MSQRTWSILTSKNGHKVPCFPSVTGDLPLHSLYDPIQEGFRFLGEKVFDGTLLIWGLGGGYHILPLLREKSIRKILVIEPSTDGVNSVADLPSIQSVISEPRVFLWNGTGSLNSWFKTNYNPIWDGRLNTLTLRSRVSSDPVTFEFLVKTVEKALEEITADLSTQARFGFRWMQNFFKNLTMWKSADLSISQPEKMVILGAGPSLEDQISLIKSEKPDLIAATDTAYPMLLASGIVPQICVSLDPQITGYHHFIPGIHSKTTFLCDILTPPGVTRRLKPLFFSSPHPLLQWMNSEVGGLPLIDTSGGNVTWAAASIGNYIGAKELVLGGCDFSYPQGKTYARGTYVYPFFDKTVNRLKDLETQCFSFALRTNEIIKDQTPSGLRYTNPLLIHYRDYWQDHGKDFSVPIRSLPGMGLDLIVPSAVSSSTTAQMFTNFKDRYKLTSWLDNFYQQTLSQDADNVKSSIGLALTPLAAYLIRVHPELEIDLSLLWSKTKSLARELLEGYYAEF